MYDAKDRTELPKALMAVMEMNKRGRNDGGCRNYNMGGGLGGHSPRHCRLCGIHIRADLHLDVQGQGEMRRGVCMNDLRQVRKLGHFAGNLRRDRVIVKTTICSLGVVTPTT